LREVAAEGWALCNGEVLETHDSNPICLPPSIGGFFSCCLTFFHLWISRFVLIFGGFSSAIPAWRLDDLYLLVPQDRCFRRTMGNFRQKRDNLCE